MLHININSCETFKISNLEVSRVYIQQEKLIIGTTKGYFITVSYKQGNKGSIDFNDTDKTSLFCSNIKIYISDMDEFERISNYLASL